jgi:outer membrane lipoprotein-sorting protein
LVGKAHRAENDSAGSLPAEGSGCTTEVAAATARVVQARYEGIRDLRADFEQVSHSASFAGEPLMDSEPKRGRVVFAKPGKMRWTYSAPDPSVVVSNGDILWIHDVEAKTATRLEVTEGYLSGAALQFLLGDGQILEEFEVQATDCGAEHVTLDLTPKVDAGYERLGLVANATSGDIVGTSIVDLFGNRTQIDFHQMEVNQDPAASIFEFIPPDGIEVIEYAADPASQTD